MAFPPTDWGDWTPEEYEVGAPATSNHFERWFRNVVAAFQAAGGAPRLALGALPRLTAGDEIRSRYDPERSASVTGTLLNADLQALSFGMLQAGTIRASFTHRATPAGGQCRIRRVRNLESVIVASYTNTTSNVSRTVDVPVLPGDLLVIEATSGTTGGGSGSSAAVYVSNVRLSTGGEDLWPGIPAPLEGMTYA